MQRPTTKPEWATTNPVNGTSGIAAIVEPSSGKKQTGFLRLEKPPRQDLNWLHNLAGTWIDFLDKRISANFLEGFSLESINDDGGGTVGVTYTDGACGMSGNRIVNSLRVNGTASLTKKLTVASVSDSWVAGNNQPGWGPGCSPIGDEVWVYAFLLYFAGTDSVDIGFADEVYGYGLDSIPNLTAKRRIGCLWYYNLTDGKILPLKQNGDYFTLPEPLTTAGGASSVISNLAETALTVPTPDLVDVVANLSIIAYPGDTTCRELWVGEYDQSEWGSNIYMAQYNSTVGVNFRTIDTRLFRIRGVDHEIRFNASGSGAGQWGVHATLNGFFDYRGKEL